MSLPEIQSQISQLPRSEQEELLRTLARQIHTGSSHQINATREDREKWVGELRQLRESLATGIQGTPLSDILDDLRADQA